MKKISEHKPFIKKLGTVDTYGCENTPIVFHNRLYRFEYVHAKDFHNPANKLGYSHFCFIDVASGESTPAFARDWHLGSAYVEGDVVYAIGTNDWGGERVDIFTSKDLSHWQSWTALDLPGWKIYNTSMCKSEDKYVLLFEIAAPKEEADVGFTARFATSKDLKHWELTPSECVYTKEHYSAPHCLRYLEGYFYLFYLHPSHGYETRLVRSKDLIHWEASPLNPVLRCSEEDKIIANPRFTASERQYIAKATNRNNSDIDFCEFKGKTIIYYNWGDQHGHEFLAHAVYDGTVESLLKGFFPEQLVQTGKRSLKIQWTPPNLLNIHGSHLPGKVVRLNYMEAYCRPGSTHQDWNKTVIGHKTELLSATSNGRYIKLQCTLNDGVVVTHHINADRDEINFMLLLTNPTNQPSDAYWALPCIKVDTFTGSTQDTYLEKSFIFVDGCLCQLSTLLPWASKARYTPGQVWCPEYVDRNNVNPRPLSELIPSNGLIGCFSSDGKMILTTAWEPYQELFQGVFVCLHSNFRIGGLKPGQTKVVHGKIYLVDADVEMLLKRYKKDFPEHSRDK